MKDELLRRALRLLEGPGHLAKDEADLIRDIRAELDPRPTEAEKACSGCGVTGVDLSPTLCPRCRL